jgi:hypothetical protein
MAKRTDSPLELAMERKAVEWLADHGTDSPLELALERKAVKWLADHGCVALKMGSNGWPDRLVLLGHDLHFWVEFKRPCGRLTRAQRLVIPRLEKMGETVVLAVSLDEVIQAYHVTKD